MSVCAAVSATTEPKQARFQSVLLYQCRVNVTACLCHHRCQNNDSSGALLFSVMTKLHYLDLLWICSTSIGV